MNINRQTFLHYVLIMLLMFAPMRGVMAMQNIHCDSSDNAIDNSVVMPDHSGHDMANMSMDADSSEQSAESSHDCCSSSSDCVSECNMSISASLLMNESSFTPKFTNTSEPISLITNLLVREFTPPFRPPLVIHT